MGVLTQEVRVLLTGKDNTKGAMKSATTGVSKLSGVVKKLVGAYALLAAGRAALRFMEDSIRLARRQQDEEIRLAAALKNVKTARQGDYEALIKQSKALQQVTTFGDEQVLSAQSMLATFQMNGETIQKLTPRILDMASAVDKLGSGEVDLQQIAIAVGKAFSSGIGALSRYGVMMSDTQKETFRLADETEKLNIITEVLDENYAGIAEMMATTVSGKVKQLQNNFGDLKESIGSAILIAGMPFISRLNDVISGSDETGKAINYLAIDLLTVESAFFSVINGIRALNAQMELFHAKTSFAKGRAERIQKWENALVNIGTSANTVEKEIEELKAQVMSGEVAVLNLGGSGVSAMGDLETAVEKATKKAEAYAKEMETIVNKIDDINEKAAKLEERRQEDIGDIREQKAQAYFDQEQLIKQLKDNLRGETDVSERSSIQSKLDREQGAFSKLEFYERSYTDQIENLRRRNQLTEFERQIEDIENKRKANEIEYKIEKEALNKVWVENESLRLKLEENQLAITENVITQTNARVTQVKSAVNEQIKDYNRLKSAAMSTPLSFGSNVQQSWGGSHFNPSFQSGGMVNAPLGRAVPALVHGGERIIPAGRSKGDGNVVNINGGTYLSENVALEMGNMIIDRLKLQLRV